MRNVVISFTLIFFCFASGLYADDKETVHSVFSNGVLSDGVTLKAGRVVDGTVVTDVLGAKGWANPRFEIHGLAIDISHIENLKQIKLKMVCKGKERPTYADIALYNSKGESWYLTGFPFRSYDASSPLYMTRGLEHTNHYSTKPAGKDYGVITGIGVNIGDKIAMELSKIEFVIQDDASELYPNDPIADPAWSNGAISKAYAVSVSERIFQDELNSRYSQENGVWKDGVITLSGARRETVGFQVVLEAAQGEDGLNDVDVIFTGVQKGKDVIDNSKAQDAKDPYNYVGKQIQLYRSRYIKMPLKAGAFVNPVIAQKANTFGRSIPSMQIPFEAKWGGAPFSIFPGKTQSVMIDVVVPDNAPAGTYRGEVKILVKNKVQRTLPVKLEVYDFSLPQASSIYNFMFAEKTYQDRHGVMGKAAEELKERYHQFYRRHYSNLQLNADYVGGELFTAENGYEGPNAGVNPSYAFLNFYGVALKSVVDPARWDAELTRLNNQKSHVPKDVKRVLYLVDEPSHGFSGGIPAFNIWVDAITPIIREFDKRSRTNTMLYATARLKQVGINSGLDAFGYKNVEEQALLKKHGKEGWLVNGPRTYQDFVSGSRIVGWKAFEKNADLWWMWESTSAPARFDLYRDPINFTNQYGEAAVGDGLFIYPGTDVQIPKRNPGLKGPVANLRFYNWRQGFIDYEYLALAEKKDPAKVAEIVRSVLMDSELSRGLPGEKRSSGYPIDSRLYDMARKQLVEVILK